MWGWITAILNSLLPWLFSGKTETKVETHEGLKDMDLKPGEPDKKLTAKDLPPLMLLGALALALSGCAFGGGTDTHHYHLVEPGAVVEVIDLKGTCRVRSPGTNEVGVYDPVGKVLMPKSVYREMRQAWIEKHSPEPAPEAKK